MRKFIGSTAVAALMAAAFVAGPAPAQAGDKKDGMISAGHLAKHGKDFYGKQVTVKAEVEDVLGAKMFTLDEDALLTGADVLVMVPRGVTPALSHDQKVVVTGMVRPYVEKDLDRDFDFFEDGKIIKKDTKVDWKTRPVIVADSVRTESGTELISTASR
jgi:hypothetical protein